MPKMAASVSVSSVAGTSPLVPSRRPLITLLDGRDCSVEMPILKDVATVAFCDAQSSSEIHDKVLNEAYGALLWDCITLHREDLLKFKALKVIIKIGSGCDNIDVTAASELGIALSNIPHVGIEETADSTMAHVLTLFRQNSFWASALKEGKQIFGPEALRDNGVNCHSLRGKVLGIVGLGRTGSAVALRAKVFGLHVIFYDPNLPDGIEISLGVEKVESLTELLLRSDCITLHCSCNPNTRNLINETTLKSMKKGAFLVNTASAHLIDEMALATRLRENWIAGAALDVHQHERTSLVDGPLADCPNLTITPHCSWYSPASDKRMREAAAQEMRRMVQFRSPSHLRYCVNADLLAFNARRHLLLAGGQTGTSAAALPTVSALMQNHTTSLLPTSAGGIISNQQANSPHLQSSLQLPVNGLSGQLSPHSSAHTVVLRPPYSQSSNSGIMTTAAMPLLTHSAGLYSHSPTGASSNNISMPREHNEQSDMLNQTTSPLNSAVDSMQRTSRPSTLSRPLQFIPNSIGLSNSRFSAPSLGGGLDQQQTGQNMPAAVRSTPTNIKQFLSPPVPSSVNNNSTNNNMHFNGTSKRPLEPVPSAPGAAADGGKKLRSAGSGVAVAVMPVSAKAATVNERADM